MRGKNVTTKTQMSLLEPVNSFRRISISAMSQRTKGTIKTTAKRELANAQTDAMSASILDYSGRREGVRSFSSDSASPDTVVPTAPESLLISTT